MCFGWFPVRLSIFVSSIFKDSRDTRQAVTFIDRTLKISWLHVTKQN